MHRLQAPLNPVMSAIWLAALFDAGIPPEDALLFPLPGIASADGDHASYMRRGVRVEVAGVDPLVLEELNNAVDGSIRAHRILLWTERSIPGSAALIRHELEHALQIEARPEVQLLHELAVDVIRLDTENSGQLYQRIPVEVDANAASGAWVRSYFGSAVISKLLAESDLDAAALRATDRPASRADLPERT